METITVVAETGDLKVMRGVSERKLWWNKKELKKRKKSILCWRENPVKAPTISVWCRVVHSFLGKP